MALTYDFDKFLNALDELEKKAKKDIVEKSLNAGADEILKRQIENVPIDKEKLKESLGKSRIKGSGLNAKISIGPQTEDKSIIVRAYVQEYGTVYMAGKKWMKKSWDEAIKDAKQAIEDTVIEELEKL